jgi:2-keto-4-pentenoate hydratase/2-oxohepta-3-ene-1,7-dioic acid hydratase in catechol pathway
MKDEIPDPQALPIKLRVNGETKQDGNTGQMIFNVAEVVAWASTLITLEPGDIIATGTLSGVGAATGDFLNAGDNVEGEIDGIGILKNPVTNA